MRGMHVQCECLAELLSSDSLPRERLVSRPKCPVDKHSIPDIEPRAPWQVTGTLTTPSQRWVKISCDDYSALRAFHVGLMHR